MRKIKVPPLHEYIRETDLIVRKSGQGEDTRVHTLRDGAVLVGHEHSPVSFENLDALWRLKLCEETVAKGDVLLWDQTRRLQLVRVHDTGFLATWPSDDLTYGYGWKEANRWCVMLRRSKSKPLPTEPEELTI